MRRHRQLLREVPAHQLWDIAVDSYLQQRFDDGRPWEADATWLAVHAELARRRRRQLYNGCTCQICFALVRDPRES